jgi:hypothetical protein
VISRGSEWHRWEPHIPGPGTILNNQFGAIDPWGAYLTALEGLTPRIEAIAVTDYYVTDTYEEFLKHKGAGRLPGVHLLFPNIELRLDVATKSGFVNIPLLVSPEDPEHLSEAKRLLKRLQFHAHKDRFDCTRDELIKLGKRADPTIVDDGAALRHGATQFKVNFDQLRKVIHESEWATKMRFPRSENRGPARRQPIFVDQGGARIRCPRQACIDPESRAYVGELPPRSVTPSQIISHVRIDGADWAATPDIPLNPGLVAIIGARGSGKTGPSRRDSGGLRCDLALRLGCGREHQPFLPGTGAKTDRRRNDNAYVGRWRDGHAIPRWQRR